MKKIILSISFIGLFSFSTEVKTVTIKFSVEEIQLVYEALGELPAKKVEGLRMRIAAEANRQLMDTARQKQK